MRTICVLKRVDGQKTGKAIPTVDVMGDPVIIAVAASRSHGIPRSDWSHPEGELQPSGG